MPFVPSTIIYVGAESQRSDLAKTWQDGVKNSVPRSLPFPLLNVASPEALASELFHLLQRLEFFLSKYL